MIGATARLNPARRAWIVDLLRFGTVGGVGFLLDSATVYASRAALGLYGSGVLAYFVAATGNWLLNRVWTFRGRGSGPAHRQWAAFLAANLVGFVLNRGTYAILVTVSALCARQPVYAIAAGAIAGLFTNFSLSRRLVFK